MAGLSKKEQRAMVDRNFGISLDYQSRAASIPNMVFKSASKIALSYCREKQETTNPERFYVRLCYLVFEAVELGCLRIIEGAAHYPHLSMQEKTAIQLANAYTEGRSKPKLASSTSESSAVIKEALFAGRILMEGQILLYDEAHFMDNFIQSTGVFIKIFDKAKQENRIIQAVKEVMANR